MQRSLKQAARAAARKFRRDKGPSSRLLADYTNGKDGPASIFNLTLLQQRANKQTNNIGELPSGNLWWIWDGTDSDLFISQHTRPALMDLVRWNGNDKDKCLTYRTLGDKAAVFCLRASVNTCVAEGCTLTNLNARFLLYLFTIL